MKLFPTGSKSFALSNTNINTVNTYLCREFSWISLKRVTVYTFEAIKIRKTLTFVFHTMKWVWIIYKRQLFSVLTWHTCWLQPKCATHQMNSLMNDKTKQLCWFQFREKSFNQVHNSQQSGNTLWQCGMHKEKNFPSKWRALKELTHTWSWPNALNMMKWASRCTFSTFELDFFIFFPMSNRHPTAFFFVLYQRATKR